MTARLQYIPNSPLCSLFYFPIYWPAYKIHPASLIGSLCRSVGAPGRLQRQQQGNAAVTACSHDAKLMRARRVRSFPGDVRIINVEVSRAAASQWHTSRSTLSSLGGTFFLCAFFISFCLFVYLLLFYFFYARCVSTCHDFAPCCLAKP